MMFNIKKIIPMLFLLLTLFSAVSRADVSDRISGTWNLQGSSASSEAKWYNYVRQLLIGQDRMQVLAIQEAGVPPISAVLLPQLTAITTPQLVNRNVAIPLEEYRWRVGRDTVQDVRYIYYSGFNDVGGNRVNIAIVSEERASRVIVLPPPVYYGSARPIIGIQLGNDIYFSVHASAAGGNDSGAIVNAIYNFIRNDNFTGQFMIMGDWNTSPATLETRIRTANPRILDDVRIISQNSATQVNGGNLDYGVVGTTTTNLRDRIAALQVFLAAANLVQLAGSDHVPVRFQ